MTLDYLRVDHCSRTAARRWRHTRGAYHRAKATNPPRRTVPGKHRYVLPLDRRMRRQVEALRSDPPRGRGLEGETAGSQPDGAGSTPADRSEPEA